jgi:hypothetical protein
MKRLLTLFFSFRPPKPVFAEDENAIRAMRIAELKWLLAEIAAPASERRREWRASHCHHSSVS